MKIFIILLVFLINNFTLLSQSLSLFDVDVTAFPTMKAKFISFDKDGKQINPTISELTLTENKLNRIITNISCPAPTNPDAISSVLVIDISGSMAGKNMNIAKSAANAWVNALPLGKSECAITSFEQLNYLNQDFSQNKSKLLQAISSLKPNGGTDYDFALLNHMAGGLEISKIGQYKKVIVLVTDGLPSQEPKVDSIVNQANKQNCKIFCVTLDMPAPNSIKEIAKRTGASYFENVTTIQEAEDIYRRILLQAQSGLACELSWLSDYNCFDLKTNIELTWLSQKSTNKYIAPISSQIELKITNNTVNFGNKNISSKNDTTITLTAINSDFNITSINRKYGSSEFSIANINFPFLIPKNSSKNITLRFEPIDANKKYASFEVVSDKCSSYFSAIGGMSGNKLINPTLHLTNPNCGENYVLGSDTLIKWEGISPSDTVSLEYSIDNGLNWNIITKQAIGLQYLWKKIPSPTSSNCLIKISQAKDSANTLTLSHSNKVYAVDFSRDGKTVATACDDFKVRIWNANTGSLIKTISDNTFSVVEVKFSPDGNRLATSGFFDNKIRIYDVNTWNLVNTITGIPSSYYSSCLDFSPDASKLAAGFSDLSARIYDVNSGNLIRTITGHNKAISDIAFSPNGQQLATACYDSTAKIWDANTGALIKTLVGHTSWLYGISYSPDASKIATSAYDKKVKIWDVNTGTELKTFIGFTDNVSDVNFSPDGNQIAASSYDYTAKLFDVNSGSLIKTFIGHTQPICKIAYSPDASKIATASWDNSVKIWNLVQNPLQEDQSDAVFSIVAPTPNSQDIDMKQCILGSSKDSLVSTFLQNKGTFPYRVDSIAIKGKDEKQFVIVSGIPPFDVPANDTIAVEFRFKPNSVGLKTAQVVIYTQADTLFQNIQGEGLSPSLSIINNLIDFGKIKINSKKDSLDVFTIKNIGSAPLTIDSITQGGPNSQDFSTLSAQGAFTLAKDDSRKLDLRFFPLEKGRTNGSILFHYNGVGSPAKVQLFGNGISGNARATIQSDTLEAYPGEIIDIPIYLKDVEDLDYSAATNFKVNLTFNSTLLEPIGDTPTGTLNSDNTRTVELELPTKPIEKDLLGKFKFKVGLGNDSTTGLILSKLIAYAGEVELTVKSGVFKLLGICRAAGPRLINPNGEVKLSLIRPNPVGDNGELDIETIENGQTELYIINLKGEKVATLYQGELAAGKQTLIISTKDISNGTYFVILQTPTVTQKVKIEVVK